ncbi:MAG: IS66 family transposase [Faecalimonas umbilicata]|uniref:IS66 family transposase n=1 Tax=Faecalimonas umbilicata TaxID=1912855 RepID=UPI00399FCBCC
MVKAQKAKTYILNRENYLMTYLEDGRCSLSNNLSENSIRPVTVGRKTGCFQIVQMEQLQMRCILQLLRWQKHTI